MPEATPKKIDLERVVLVPVFLVCVVAVVSALPETAATATTFAHALFLTYRALLVVFYALMIVLLMARPEPSARAAKVFPRVAAYAGLFLTCLIPATGASTSGPVLSAIGVAVMVAGLAFSIYSLAILGRSFSVAPQVRTLVQHGPYRHIRHPLYSGEIITLVGVLCCNPRLPSVLVFVIWVAIQVYRALQEEKLLERNLEDYAEYKRQTKRFIAKVI
jgi:protein-S-isoprenylcysteine O-methyltransferase Ste14